MWFRKRRPSSIPPIVATFDRGPSKFFHGRNDILGNFRELAELSTQTKTGSTFLIQGAPGAGKTALLAECAKHARSEGWRVAEINTPDLWDPDELYHPLGLRKRKPEDTTVRREVRGGLEVGVRRGAINETMKTLLHKCRDPVLLILNEAQTLERIGSSDRAESATGMLNTIHNSKMGKAVILLAAGLGRTKEIFRTFGISRFHSAAFVELGALEKEAERAVSAID